MTINDWPIDITVIFQHANYNSLPGKSNPYWMGCWGKNHLEATILICFNLMNFNLSQRWVKMFNPHGTTWYPTWNQPNRSTVQSMILHGFGGMIQSTTEPIGQPLVMGSGAMLVILYILCVYIYVMYIYILCIYYLVGGLEHEWIIFPFTWECHHPNWRACFFRGVGIPPTSYMYIYIPS
jgi:hypothetical protein